MKQIKFKLKTLISLALILLAVVSIFNVTNSYFTATAKREGNINFSSLNVRFVYDINDVVKPTVENNNRIPLFMTGVTSLSRGDTFKLSLTQGGTAIKYLAVQNVEGSCDALVRFWVDAYIVKKDANNVEYDDETVNYGQYFVFNSTDVFHAPYVAVANSQGATNPAYCIKNIVSNGLNTSICSEMKLSETAPVELLGSKVRIYFSLDAVQASNGAYMEVYKNDPRGYLNSWSNL